MFDAPLRSGLALWPLWSGFERKWGEVRIAIVIVLVFGAFQEADDAVGQRRHDDLPTALEQVLRQHHGFEQFGDPQAVEGDRIEQRRVHQLPAQREADGAGPEPAAVGPY